MKQIRLFYFNDFQNFGDAINPILMERLFKIKCIHATPNNADMVAIGSILAYFLWKNRKLLKYYYLRFMNQHPLHIFGTGFIQPPWFLDKTGCMQKEMFLRKNITVNAARGLLTKQRLETMLDKKQDKIAIGDPGLLASYLIDKDKIKKKYAMGIIPHFFDKNNAKLNELLELNKHFKIIDIADDPIRVLEQIYECETIISSAMHGLIAADSLNIPNTWIKFSDFFPGKENYNYKFNDYYSVFNIKEQSPIDITAYDLKNITPQMIAEKYEINHEEVKNIQKGLIEAFPFK